jgi:hypothetical protein
MIRQPGGWLTKDGALELLSLSLNNSKGFSKKTIIFSEFQAFRKNAPGLIGNFFGYRSGGNELISRGRLQGGKNDRE